MKKWVIVILVLIILLLILFGIYYYFEHYRKDTSSVPVAEEKVETVPLPADPGLPAVPPGDMVIHHKFYTLAYNERYEQPDWVMYKLIADSLKLPKFPRKDRFRSDPAVPTGSATPGDYKRSGYDRGHLLPAGAMSWSKEALSETFYMSNMSPQKPQFNRGIWKQLEAQVRKWALENEELYVVTGPVLRDSLPTIGENEVGVPRYYYKVILDLREPEVKTIAFLLSNEKHSEPLRQFVVTIDSVESLTGIDFFPQLPDVWEDSLEKTIAPNRWFDEPLP